MLKIDLLSMLIAGDDAEQRGSPVVVDTGASPRVQNPNEVPTRSGPLYGSDRKQNANAVDGDV